MKLATVNPRLDFNIESLLTKDVSKIASPLAPCKLLYVCLHGHLLRNRYISSSQILQSRAGPSSTLGFSPDVNMTYPQLHPSQAGLIQAGLPGMGNSSESFRRTMNIQLAAMSGGYKEPTQVALHS